MCEKCAEDKGMCSMGKVVVYASCRGGVPMELGINLRERQVEVSRVRVVQKLSYAETVKKVEEDGSRGGILRRVV